LFFADAIKKKQPHILAHLVALPTSPSLATKRAKISLPTCASLTICVLFSKKLGAENAKIIKTEKNYYEAKDMLKSSINKNKSYFLNL